MKVIKLFVLPSEKLKCHKCGNYISNDYALIKKLKNEVIVEHFLNKK